MGINHSQFLQIAMIAQGDFLKLLLAPTEERKKIFRQIFKTQLYQDLQDRLKKESGLITASSNLLLVLPVIKIMFLVLRLKKQRTGFFL